jgi:hypothetical protein
VYELRILYELGILDETRTTSDEILNSGEYDTVETLTESPGVDGTTLVDESPVDSETIGGGIGFEVVSTDENGELYDNTMEETRICEDRVLSVSKLDDRMSDDEAVEDSKPLEETTFDEP